MNCMIKKWSVLLLSLALLFLVDCANANNPPSGNTFFGTVLECSGEVLFIEPEFGSWARNSADKIAIPVSNVNLLESDGNPIKLEQIAAGAKVKISFTGGITKSDPAQIRGCYEVRLLQPKYSLDDFLLLREMYGYRLGNLMPQDLLEREIYVDITPGAVLDEIGVQIFKDSEWCSAYLMDDDFIYPLGVWFGGYGVVDIKTCDFDGNGTKDILFTYSWGSGLHRSLIGLFDMSTMMETVIYDSSDEGNDEAFISCDLVLEKKSDDDFEVYIADFPNTEGFVVVEYQRGQLIGKIINSGGEPTWQAQWRTQPFILPQSACCRL